MPSIRRIVIEACVGSLDDALDAYELGADRLEFCASLDVGGLTPDFEDVRVLRDRVDIPIMAMVRPRAGDFQYSQTEWRSMLEDAARLLWIGVDGIVFGALTREKRIDSQRTSEMVAAVKFRRKEAVFHKAFDESEDLLESWATLKTLGVDRVLTSGGSATALDGAGLVQRLVLDAGDRRPMVLVGGGVRTENVVEILQRTGAGEIHAACRRDESRKGLDPRKLKALIAAVRTQELASERWRGGPEK
jgi:copper homeostasis protein